MRLQAAPALLAFAVTKNALRPEKNRNGSGGIAKV